MIDKFQELADKSDLFIQIIDAFPYPIAVFSPDGVLVLANNTLLADIGLKTGRSLAGKYNIYLCGQNDLSIVNAVKQAFQGETVQLLDLEDSLCIFSRDGGVFTAKSPQRHDAIVFPVMEDGGDVGHTAVIWFNQRR